MSEVFILAMPFIAFGLTMTGCGPGVDTKKNLSEVRGEARGLTVRQLENMASGYEKTLRAKNLKMEKLRKRLQNIPLSQMLDKKARDIQDDIRDLNISIRALNERLSIYLRELHQKHG